MENTKAISLLKECSNRDDIEKIFSTYDVEGFEKKIKLLKQCTGEINEYFAGEDNKYSEEDYEYELVTFLDGTWRVFSAR